jgi:transcriptional regulator GlxA family with amidase domain
MSDTAGSTRPSASGTSRRALDGEPFDVSFILIPHFPLMPHAAAVEPLRAANRLSGRTLYRWTVATPDGAAVQASNGMTVLADLAMADIARPDLVLVCAGTGVEKYRHRPTFSTLRALARRGCLVGGISAGAYVLARAGLLAGHRCSIHWEQAAGFAEEFPEVRVGRRLFELDRNRLTCAGGVSALDLMHALISGHHGTKLATAVSESFLYTQIRGPDSPQRLSPRERFGISDPRLLELLVRMESNVEEPVARSALAAQAGVSVRQLDRLFRRHVGCSPAVYYSRLRLEHARRMLQQTALSVGDIATACGYGNASHFARSFRKQFGHAPHGERHGSD